MRDLDGWSFLLCCYAAIFDGRLKGSRHLPEKQVQKNCKPGSYEVISKKPRLPFGFSSCLIISLERDVTETCIRFSFLSLSVK